MDDTLKNYTGILIDELFKCLDSKELSLTDITLEKMGKIFSHVTTQKNRRIAYSILGTLDEHQFNAVYSNMDGATPSMLAKLPFISPHIKKDEDLLEVFSALGRTVSKSMLISTKNWRWYRWKNAVVKSKLPYDVLTKLKPLPRLKVLRLLSETKEYPLTEPVAKKELEIGLFPLVFQYKQGIQNFIDNWRW